MRLDFRAGQRLLPQQTYEAHVPELVNHRNQPDSYLVSNGKLFLEDLDITAQGCRTAGDWATHLSQQVFADRSWHIEFRKRFVVLPDDIFDFLADTGTEVQAHVRIDPNFKRVAEGALWYEESLPAESILCGLVWCDEPRGVTGVQKSNVVALLNDSVLQMGGKATTGKGRVQLRFTSATSATPQGNVGQANDPAEGGSQ